MWHCGWCGTVASIHPSTWLSWSVWLCDRQFAPSQWSLHHNEFVDFKKAETDTDNRNFEMNSLLHFYIRQHPQSGTFVTKKYGKTYLTCTCGQVDELCQWIYDMRKQHPKIIICMRETQCIVSLIIPDLPDLPQSSVMNKEQPLCSTPDVSLTHGPVVTHLQPIDVS